MARPRKADKDKMAARFPTTRCTDDDLALVRQLASEAGQPVTGYIRMAAMQKMHKAEAVPAMPSAVLQPEFVLELRRQGVNINQIAKVANTTGEISPQFEAVLQKQEYLLDRLIEMLM